MKSFADYNPHNRKTPNNNPTNSHDTNPNSHHFPHDSASKLHCTRRPSRERSFDKFRERSFDKFQSPGLFTFGDESIEMVSSHSKSYLRKNSQATLPSVSCLGPGETCPNSRYMESTNK